MRLMISKLMNMVELTQLRIIGYIAILSMYVANIYYMEWYARQANIEDEKVLVFRGLGNRFFTTWNLMLQIAYGSFSLLCEFVILKNARKKSYTLPSYVTNIRDTMFSGLIWPTAFTVSSFFWTLYKYDRSLIFPEHLDVVLPPVSNHILHTAIVAVVLFEVMSRPRTEPTSHVKNLALITLYMSVYLSVMIYTFIQRGVWLYPIFAQLYGTIYLPLALCSVWGLMFIFYYLQWPLNNLLHKEGVRKPRKILPRKKKF